MRKASLLMFVLTAALITWLFAPALTGGSSFAFRDAAHFYHPLFQYIRGEWAAGRVPLWNPYENLGVPLVAENTSSVFYPGKLLFALPLDYTWLYNMYIVGHVALAAATSYRLARHLRASTLGSIVGALSYAFSGNVLFQYCNVIFLVGAAWLPLALLYADRMLRLHQRWAVVGFGVVVGLIVLGGDPHLAYNLGLVSLGYAGMLWWHTRRQRRLAEGDQVAPPIASWRVRTSVLYLTAGTMLAGLLAAIQVLPSLEASPYGERAQYDSPRNIYEYARESIERGPDDVPLSGLWGATARGHHSHVYAFSVAPWRVFEMLWPNAAGRPFPTNRRWQQAIDIEANLWSPSLYFGLLSLLLAVRAFSVRRAPLRVRAISWLALVSGLGSLGSYGLGMAVKMLLGTGDNLDLGDEVGGLYWLLATVCPGYIQFRYPQKLFVLTSIALSMLAALGWRRAWTDASTIWRWLLAISAVSMAAIAAAWFAWPHVVALRSEDTSEEFQGPLDWNGAWNDLVDGMLSTALLAAALGLIFWIARRQGRFRPQLQIAALTILAIDLAAAQQYLFEFAPSELWMFQTTFDERFGGSPQRVYRTQSLLPPSFKTTLSQNRYVEAIEFDRKTLSPKYPLPDRQRVLPVSQSVAGNDFEMVLDAGIRYSRRHAIGKLPDAILDMWAVDMAVVPSQSKDLLANPLELAEAAYLGQRPTAFPRAWIVHQVEAHDKFQSRSPRETLNFTYKLMYPDNKPRDWRRVAVVETAEAVNLPAGESAEAPPGESCAIERDEPLTVEIQVKLTAPGLVVLADQFFPGWELTVETNGQSRKQPILRTNRVLRGAVLSAGEHRLIYRYRPKSFLAGAILSALACAGVGIAAAVRWRHARTAKLPTKGHSKAMTG